MIDKWVVNNVCKQNKHKRWNLGGMLQFLSYAERIVERKKNGFHLVFPKLDFTSMEITHNFCITVPFHVLLKMVCQKPLPFSPPKAGAFRQDAGFENVEATCAMVSPRM